jgi:hypothetical protein
MSTQRRKQHTRKVGPDPATTFRIPAPVLQQLSDAAWERKLPMGELLRRFTVDGLARLAGERNSAAIPTSGADVTAHI